MRSLLLLVLLAVGGCATTPPAPAPAAAAPPLPFIEDDYDAALAAARERGVPLFVDAWAPWCHTCLSMHAHVFGDPRLAKLADRFVWLSIDTEREQNTDFVARHPMRVWPTLYVIDPRADRPVLRWLGSATTEQLIALLEDGERAVRGGAEGADALLARADRLAAAGEVEKAASTLEQLLEQAPADWRRRARAVESLLFLWNYSDATDRPACAELAAAELERLPRSASWGNVALVGLSCALKDPASAGLRPTLEAHAREAIADPAVDMAADDKAGLYDFVARARQQAGDEAGARAVAGEWLAFLEAEAARAPTREARAVHDYNRMRAALLLGEPERALEPLRRSERELPDRYEAPARLTTVYRALGRLEEALAANGRALALVYGPRRVSLTIERGAILAQLGRREEARAAYRKALKLSERLPAAQRSASYEKRAREALEAL